MATMSVLNFNLQQALKSKIMNIVDKNSASASNEVTPNHNLSKTFSKITVQNILSENNANTLNISNNSSTGTTNVRKFKDFGVYSSMHSSFEAKKVKIEAAPKNFSTPLRKRTASETKSESKPETATKSTPKSAKKPKIRKEVTTPKSTKKSAEPQSANFSSVPQNASNPSVVVVKPAGTPGRKGLPLPLAVARRNARERNRVKQVNNGFAALRERIPEEVAEAFEVQGSGRNAAKKLSKVETLRMAVEYIRSLERLLGFDFEIPGNIGGVNGTQNNSSCDDSFAFIKDEFDALSPGIEENFEDSLNNYDVQDFFDNSVGQQETYEQPLNVNHQLNNQFDLLPNITTLNGLQYIRIPGTNTYQLLTPDLFIGNSHSPPNSSIDDEHFNAIIDTNCHSPAASSPSSTIDHNSSPTSINPTTTIPNVTAPAIPTATTHKGELNSSLSRSPVPQTSSPIANVVLQHNQQQLQLAQQQQQQRHKEQSATLSPAPNDFAIQTCATARLSNETQFMEPIGQHQQLQQQSPKVFIKEEYVDREYTLASTPSPMSTAMTTSLHPQLLINRISPGLEHCMPHSMLAPTPLPGLHTFFVHDQEQASFYETIVPHKKDLNDVLLDTSATTPALSDESMIEAIEWWEAHTPKSDGGSAVH